MRLIKEVFREHPVILVVFFASYAGSISARFIGVPSDITLGIALPALVLSGWTAFGHLITLDDDYPGEWSNPEKSKTLWRRSLLQLAAEMGVFGLLVLVLAL